MRKTKIILTSLLLTLALLLPPLGTGAFALVTEPQFDDTFVGALDEKFERLTTLEGEKIVVVGGSSVAFGLDSARLESYTGMPVVNFGLYASLGTKLMLDLSLVGIGDGDVVVIAPEINAETLSLYFGADTAWRAIEGDFSMLKYIDIQNMPAMLGALYPYASAKLERMLNGKRVPHDGEIYLSKYFNEYGDFAMSREENIMDGYRDPNTPIELDIDAYGEELEEFLDYLNSYIKKCKRRGARVYFTFCPMNALALRDSTEEKRAEFADYLENVLGCEIISDIESCIFDAGYFFDTNFHLNSAGAQARTIRLAKDLKLALGITNVITDEEPAPPALPEIDIIYNGTDENARYFTYALNEDGTYEITGLSELGLREEELTLPLGYNGYKVTSVGEGALSSEVLCALTVTADSNVKIFKNGAFLGASALKDLYIYKTSGDDIAPPASFAGVNKSFTVHIPKGTDFPYHYYWSERGLTFSEDIG